MASKRKAPARKTPTFRRVPGSDVPLDRYVYLAETHFSSDGGPRPIAPLKIMENLDAEHYDGNLWPRLLQAAFEQGTPIEVAPDNARMYQSGRVPLADLVIWDFAERHLFIVSERANNILLPLLQQACRPVPVTCKEAPYHGYRIENILDNVVDIPNSKADWRDDEEIATCTSFDQYAFHTANLGHIPMFFTPHCRYELLVLQSFVELVFQHQLNGFTYKRVWPASKRPPTLSVPVKRLPASAAAATPPGPVFSTAATAVPADFAPALLGDPLTDDHGKPAHLVAYRLPDLALPTGRIVAADLHFAEGPPFVTAVPPGTYPLTLIAARLGARRQDERIAFALLQFNDRPVAAWQHAPISPRTPNGNPAPTYPVDSGNGGLADAAAQEALLNLSDPEGTVDKKIESHLEKSYQHTRAFVHIHTHAGDAAIFSAGYGDGSYASYFALDAQGAPVALVTDFGVLNWPRRPE